MTQARAVPPAARDNGARRPARADAARNRSAIIDAATVVFAQRGHQVDVREIARRAGIGMGTLYRHFPTKDALLETVLHEDFLAWSRSARADAAGHTDPWTALSAFLDDALTRHARHRAMLERFAHSWDSASSVTECSRQLLPVIDEILTRCHAAGALRQGVTSEDIALVLISLGRIVELTAHTNPALWRRHLRICLDGLRHQHDEALPPPAPAAGHAGNR